MATKIRPIVFKVNEPEGFVMNAANAVYEVVHDIIFVSWQSPSYPNVYNGNDKQYILVNNNATAAGNNPLMYTSTSSSSGPNAVGAAAMNVLGTSTGTLLNNVAAGSGYGVYLAWPFNPDRTLEEVQAYMANVSITILDP